MPIIYETNSWSNRINPIEITRETAACYFYRGHGGERRMNKSENTHKTYEAARARIIDRARQDVERAKSRLEVAEMDLADALEIPEHQPESEKKTDSRPSRSRENWGE